MSASKRNEKSYVVAAAALIIGLVVSPAGDQGFFAIVLLGPIATGIGAGLFGVSWRTGAAPWALAGLFFLGWDGFVNSEDVATHTALIGTMVALVALGALTGTAVRRAASRSEVARM